jgi:hypothetical protein
MLPDLFRENGSIKGLLMSVPWKQNGGFEGMEEGMHKTATSKVSSRETNKLGPIRSEAAILEPLERHVWPGISLAVRTFDPCSLVDLQVCRVLFWNE